MTKTFGVRHAGFLFTPLIELSNKGFIYRGKQYKWEDIIALRSDDKIPALARYPSTVLLLSDATIVRIPGIIEQKGRYDGFQLQIFKSKSSAYYDLVSVIKANCSNLNSSLKEKLISYNYIMFYRLLIIVGLIFLPATMLLFNVPTPDKKVFIVPIGFFLAFILGITLLIRKIKLEKQIKEQFKNNSSKRE